MLESEFKYYLDNRDELVKKFLGRYLIIKDQQVVGDYATEMDAYNDGLSKYEPGAFLIQQCLPGDKSITQTFRSRVVFK